MPAMVEVDKEENPCFQNLTQGQTWGGVKHAVWSGRASAQVPEGIPLRQTFCTGELDKGHSYTTPIAEGGARPSVKKVNWKQGPLSSCTVKSLAFVLREEVTQRPRPSK